MKQDFLKPTEVLVPSWKQTAFYQEGGQLLGDLGLRDGGLHSSRGSL